MKNPSISRGASAIPSLYLNQPHPSMPSESLRFSDRYVLNRFFTKMRITQLFTKMQLTFGLLTEQMCALTWNSYCFFSKSRSS